MKSAIDHDTASRSEEEPESGESDSDDENAETDSSQMEDEDSDEDDVSQHFISLLGCLFSFSTVEGEVMVCLMLSRVSLSLSLCDQGSDGR